MHDAYNEILSIISHYISSVVGAYAIPLACLSSVVLSVYTITTSNNWDIRSIFSANVYHVPGLCLPGIGGTLYISHKIIARKLYFHIKYFDFFSETTSR